MVHRGDVAVVVEGALLCQARARRHHGVHRAEGIETNAVDIGIMRGQFLGDIITRVIAFIQCHVLASLGEIHTHNFSTPQWIGADDRLSVGKGTAVKTPWS